MKSSFLLSVIILAYTSMSQLFAHEVTGPKIAMGNGYAQTFVITDAHKHPVSIGIKLTEGALNNLPEVDHAFSLRLPNTVSVPPYKEIIINWNPHGHEPTEIYGAPHFDFHFYIISKAVRESIMCMGADEAICLQKPIDDFIAPFYIPTPAGVPMMGWHWLDSRSPELNGQKFTSTFIHGYYGGELIFLEPMITREFMQDHGVVNQELSIPKRYPLDGYYPKKYSLHYDSEQKFYRIVFKELQLRETK